MHCNLYGYACTFCLFCFLLFTCNVFFLHVPIISPVMSLWQLMEKKYFSWKYQYSRIRIYYNKRSDLVNNLFIVMVNSRKPKLQVCAIGGWCFIITYLRFNYFISQKLSTPPPISSRALLTSEVERYTCYVGLIVCISPVISIK